MEEEKLLTLNRYGVQAVMMKSKIPPFKPEWQVIPSLPDLEGVIFGSGRQVIIECKVCSQASYPLANTDKERPKQLNHMFLRSRFGAQCYYLIHFPERKLIRTSQPARTFAIPVHPDFHLWREYQARERLSIGRNEGEVYGIEVKWDAYSPRASKLTPNLNFLLPEPAVTFALQS